MDRDKLVLHAGFYLVFFTPLAFGLHDTPADTQPAVARVVAETPFLEKWASSAHADATAEAFTHWNEEDPQEIPEACAKCHSPPGFRDFTRFP